MPPHPKPVSRAKKPGAMKTKPKASKVVTGLQEAAAGMLTVKKLPAAEGKVIAMSKGETKGAMILAMLKGDGATSKQLEAATGWAPHSVRGFLGTLRKRGVKVISMKLPKEPTIYRIEAAAELAGEVL